MLPSKSANNASSSLNLETTQLLHHLPNRETPSGLASASLPDTKDALDSLPVAGLFGSSSDPFNDSMDLILMRIQVPRSRHSSVNSPTRLNPVLDTDVDEHEIEEEASVITVTSVGRK